MEADDERLEPVRTFIRISLRLEDNKWQEFVSKERNRAMFSHFFSEQGTRPLFLHRDPDSRLSAGPDFPHSARGKVICVSKTSREAATKENCRKILLFQEVKGDNVLNFVSATEQVTRMLLMNLGGGTRQVVVRADRALDAMERQRMEAMTAQIDGCTFLPHPRCLEDHGPHADGETRELLNACEQTVKEWAELVSDFLQQDLSQPVLDGLRAFPSEEFKFWRIRLKNLQSIQEQLMSRRAQQVVSIIQKEDSIYQSTLTDVYRDVSEGLKEAMDVVMNLGCVEEKLHQLEQVEYRQLESNMASLVQEICEVWIRSEFYCRPLRMVVLLQETCYLLTHLSRKFLRGQEMMSGLEKDPGLVLDDVRLVIRTLQTFKEEYSQVRVQDQSWDFPLNIVFVHLDGFLLHLQHIQEALCVTLPLQQLHLVAECGVNGRMWISEIQDLLQDLLNHMTVLTGCDCDPTDPEDQCFQQHLVWYQERLEELQRRLVSLITRNLQSCSCSSSFTQLLRVFSFVLDLPVVQDQLRPQLRRLLLLVQTELDEVELLLRHRAEVGGDPRPAAAARLCWAQQLQARAEHAARNYSEGARLLGVDSTKTQLVQLRLQDLVQLLQDFTHTVESDWSVKLDSDCGFILEQNLIHITPQGMLGVSSSHKVEALLRELGYVTRFKGVELRLQAAQLYTCRHDIKHSYLALSQMVSHYNQVVSNVQQVEFPLIQDQMQDLKQSLSDLIRTTWSSEGLQQQVMQHRDRVLSFHSWLSEARANMDTMTHIIQGWAELHLLQRTGDSLLEGGASPQSCRRIRQDGQELLQLTQVNQRLYRATESSESWTTYLDHIDDQVLHGLFQLLLREMNFLCDSMDTQGRGPLFAVSLQLQETGSVFEPSVGSDLCDIIRDVYSAASLSPRISVSRRGDYQVCVRQRAELRALEQEVHKRVLQVKEEAEHLRTGLDRYSDLWQSDRQEVMQEFLTYGVRLGSKEELEETPPTLMDFQREMESLHALRREVSHLDDVIVLRGWLQVDLRHFKCSLLSIIHSWSSMFTQQLVEAVTHRVHQAPPSTDLDDEEPSSSSSFPLIETIMVLEAEDVELPQHLAAQLQVEPDLD